MNNVDECIEILEPVMKAIAQQFGESCEVVLHDLTKDYSSTIIAIENGHITGRKVGDCGSNLGLEVLRGVEKEGNKYNYITQTKDGKTLRSSSIYYRDSNGKVIGSLCINLDITELIMAEETIKKYTYCGEQDKEVFTNDVNELLNYLIEEAQKLVGKPVSYMTKEDKIKFLNYLDKKGGFLITKSGARVCDYLGISKYTLYNYLELCKE